MLWARRFDFFSQVGIKTADGLALVNQIYN